MERLYGWQRFTRSIEWIITPHKAYEKERLEKEAEREKQAALFTEKLQTPEMKARVAEILDKYNIVAHRESVFVPENGRGPILLIEPTFQETFKRIVRNQRPATVFYSLRKMDEMGLPGVMWVEEGEIRISSDQYVLAMFGGVFDHAEDLGYKKIQDGIDFISQTPYGRFVQETSQGRTK